MRTFLLPVDFSATTLATCKHAIYLAGQEKTRLFLFHIYPDQLIVPDSSIPAGIDSDAFFNVEFIETLRKQAEEQMKKLKVVVDGFLRAWGFANIEVSSLVTGGDPEWEIRRICKETNPGLIVMGTEGEGRKGILEGSMAEKIMNRVKFPVVAVPQSFEKDRIRNIMYATNFSNMDVPTLTRVFSLLKNLEFVVHVVHFRFDEKDEKCKLLMEGLERAFEKERLAGKITFNLVPATDKLDVLATFTQKYEIDMIAFLSHKKNFFQNLFSQKISKKDFFKLELPMMALHE
ncbi:MAG: universal stress protein [Bacteroidales bacterium]|nr:universal stress protein [Bacteroidales bacterium]MCF6342453.1 universal stress protein [Bacteroidales bacterium]